MKCPLRIAFKEVAVSGRWLVTEDCLKEECAWWDGTLNVCSIRIAAAELKLISESMTLLLAKMPHEGQFRDR